MIDNLYRGDTWELNFQIFDSNDNPIDLTTYSIRAELVGENKSIKKANKLVEGGSDNEIKVLDTEGNLVVIFTKEDTHSLEQGLYNFEIEITDPSGKRSTVIRDMIKVTKDIVDWENK